MLSNQNQLPKLPVPSLAETMESYLEWINPLLCKDDLIASKKKVDTFIQLNGDGEKLQKKLLEIHDSIEGSWLKPFWDDMYLTFRGALVPNMNYYAILENKELNKKYTLEGMVGKGIHEITKFYFQVATNTFEPDTIKGTPLCMEQYVNIFKAVRVPKKDKDQYLTYEFIAEDTYVIVYHKNNLYKVAVTDEKGDIYCSDKIAIAIKKIIELDELDKGNNVGAITTMQRDKSARVLEQISANEVNRKNLDVINKALIVVCLDEESEDQMTRLRAILLSDGKNRYFDKSGQLIINKSGEMAFNNEHTGADGTTWFAIFDKMHQAMMESEGNSNLFDSQNETKLPVVEAIEWELSEAMKKVLDQAQCEHIENSEKIFVDGFTFDLFGKDQIKSLKISPDAFFHIALQLAQYRTFGKLRSTYEPVAVRHFRQGRTECARAVNNSVLKFVKVVDDNQIDSKLKYELLNDAVEAHIKRIRECQRGLGIERHLHGLRKVYDLFGEDIGIREFPEIFTDQGLTELKNDFLSTSGLGSEAIQFFGFGPVVEDGFGIGYGIKKHSISVTISCKKDNQDKAEDLVGYLFQSFIDLRSLMEGQK